MMTRQLTAAMLATALVGGISQSASADRIFFDNRDLQYTMLPAWFDYADSTQFSGTGLDLTASPAEHVASTPPTNNQFFRHTICRTPFTSTEFLFDHFFGPAGTTIAVQEFFVSEGEQGLQGQLPRIFLDGESVGPTALGTCFGGDFCGPISGFGFQPGLRKYLGTQGVAGFRTTLDGQTHYAYIWMRCIEFPDRPDAYVPIGWGYDDTPDAPVEIFIPNSSCQCEFDGVAGVSVSDLLAFLVAWFADLNSAPVDGFGTGADIESDGVVDVLDLLKFLACYFPAASGADCP